MIQNFLGYFCMADYKFCVTQQPMMTSQVTGSRHDDSKLFYATELTPRLDCLHGLDETLF